VRTALRYQFANQFACARGINFSDRRDRKERRREAAELRVLASSVLVTYLSSVLPVAPNSEPSPGCANPAPFPFLVSRIGAEAIIRSAGKRDLTAH